MKIVCQNKKARHEYFLDEFFEAGLVLMGAEVKSLREGRASLVDSYARVKRGRFSFITCTLPLTPLPTTWKWIPCDTETSSEQTGNQAAHRKNGAERVFPDSHQGLFYAGQKPRWKLRWQRARKNTTKETR
jgi:hypothetical protein